MVRQEIHLSEDRAAVICGHDEITWVSLYHASWCINKKLAQLTQVTSSNLDMGQHFRSCALHIHRMIESRGARAGKILAAGVTSACHDARDRIYGLLGIIDEAAGGISMKPDYSKTTSEVYQDLVLVYLESHRQLDIIALTGLDRVSSGLPTWVPDWRVQTHHFQ